MSLQKVSIKVTKTLNFLALHERKEDHYDILVEDEEGDIFIISAPITTMKEKFNFNTDEELVTLMKGHHEVELEGN